MSEEKIVQEKPEPKITVRAVITRADGTKEDLGIIAVGGLEDWQTSSGPK